jgi:hypothetical protein
MHRPSVLAGRMAVVRTDEAFVDISVDVAVAR